MFAGYGVVELQRSDVIFDSSVVSKSMKIFEQKYVTVSSCCVAICVQQSQPLSSVAACLLVEEKNLTLNFRPSVHQDPVKTNRRSVALPSAR